MVSVLIIDDDETIRKSLNHHFVSRGWASAAGSSGAQGRSLAEELTPDVILLDMKLPDQDGLDVLKALKAQGCAASIIIMTGWGSISNAVETVKLGAEHYLPKPFQITELDTVIDRIVETRKLRIENRYYQQRMDHPVIGISMEVHKLHHMIDLMAENADTTALLLGESGTGKELVAREIHRRSARRERPFLDINCAVLSETLLESQLFGHERGAFTDAHELKRGLLEVADGGTVLLDEIGEMPAAVQPKLLRMLETRTFRRVGGTVDLSINVRVIAATNQDLERAVTEGRFREDLFYRLHVFPIHLPPLRKRAEDVPVLAEHFLNQFNTVLKKTATGFSGRAMDVMTRYAWPGNIRELKNIVERTVVLSQGGQIDLGLLPPEIAGHANTESGSAAGEGFRKNLSQVEREYILRVLREEKNNRTTTAKVLGISRSTLHEKLRKYGIS